MLEDVRAALLREARQSPGLLSDLAGLEEYVAESYSARSFIELLQNADDAGAARFAVLRCGRQLFVANDGRPFNRDDFESLCRSAASSKDRAASIGFRGIGFKSVVGLAQTIYLISDGLETVFSRERTAREVPQASRLPLVRIPHFLEDDDRRALGTTHQQLINDGFRTIFVFDDLIGISIEAEFAEFDPTALLFLRHVRQVELRAATETVITIRRDGLVDGRRAVRLATPDGLRNWVLMERSGVVLAFARTESGITCLDEREAVVHAFLPTHEPTGLGIKIHGDISTDPSRTRIVFDERTATAVKAMARTIVDVVATEVSEDERSGERSYLAGLLPRDDPRLASLQRRSFRTELLAAMQAAASGRFESFRYRPSWLNPNDFTKLAAAAEIRTVSSHIDLDEATIAFLRFLGVKEAALQELAPALAGTTPSVAGAAEVVARLTHLHTTQQVSTAWVERDWRLWPVGGRPLSLLEAEQADNALDADFVDLVQEKLGIPGELRRLLSNLTTPEVAGELLPAPPDASPSPDVGMPVPSLPFPSQAQGDRSNVTLKRWRSAEQHVLALLVAEGWNVRDVSRQNLGFDIAGRNPAGAEVFIEVKAIDYPGQPFIMTSNEEVVARQQGRSYILAIVRQTDAILEVAFITDPANHLALTRQCRQWAWECSSYTFHPNHYHFE